MTGKIGNRRELPNSRFVPGRVLWATWRLAAWTGDSSHIDDPLWRNFQEKTVGPYIESWVLEADWWDDSLGRYHTWYSNDGRFGVGEGETFLLWFDALHDTARVRRTIDHLASGKWNIENISYFSLLFYREGYWDTARQTILYLADPHTPRREYPEVSFGVVQAVVMGLMGVNVLPGTRTVSTFYRHSGGDSAWLADLPILGTKISVRHTGLKKSALSNTGSGGIVWRAEFPGMHTSATVAGRTRPMQQQQDKWGHTVSYVEIPVAAGGRALVMAN